MSTNTAHMLRLGIIATLLGVALLAGAHWGVIVALLYFFGLAL